MESSIRECVRGGRERCRVSCTRGRGCGLSPWMMSSDEGSDIVDGEDEGIGLMCCGSIA